MPSVQEKINIKDIHDDVVILDNGSIRAILLCSSINFFLKSEDEQTALTYGYQDFLNSLDFSIQILMTSRKFDLSDYLATLEEKLKTQENELLKIQISEYLGFIKSLMQTTNIMSEMFFIIIPFAQTESKGKGIMDQFTKIFKKEKEMPIQDFNQMKTQLWHRVDMVTSGLSRIGIKATHLKTEELLELYYGMYNPEAKEKANITAIKENKVLE